ncbi:MULTISPECIES: Cro/CI family transcriptional regulator [Atlantibacter]|uniref:Cro/CI family transcriptional regulator n=1 Tax=Atlantibacter TaxID=1903434 RepID=UPI0028A85C89|nr:MULTISPECIES: Cro/CI family transcriptional regulator [Atlantibacter]MDW2745121.1 Cro/CI family transcriptional regulator [Atlantibacter subterranea]
MVTFTLKDFVSEIGQVRAGLQLGVTQIAISKALRSGRNIFVRVSNGQATAYEAKPFPAKPSAHQDSKHVVVGISLAPKA